MKKFIAFGASNSPGSINKTSAVFTANQLTDVAATTLDLNDFELPVYNPALEQASAVPTEAKAYATQVQNCDGIVVFLAEHSVYALRLSKTFGIGYREFQWKNR